MTQKMVSYKELIRFIWQYVRLQKWRFALIFLLDSLAWPVEALTWPYILHVVVDIFTRFDGDRLAAWQALHAPILGAICLVIYIEAASRTMGFLLAKGNPVLQANLRMTMFDHIQHHSPRYFNERFAGSLANKITDMTTQVETIVSQLFWPLIPSFVACISGVVILWFIHPLFAGIWFTWFMIHIGISLAVTRPIDVFEHRHGEARSSLLGKIVDSFTNNFAVNLFYRFQYEKNIITPFQNKELETNIAAKRYTQKTSCYISIVHFFGFVLGINGSLLYLWVHGQITTGQAVQVFMTLWSLITILWGVGISLPTLFQSFGTAKQAYSLMREPQDLGDKPGAQDLKISLGEIVFDKVHFRYGDQKLFENKQVKIRGGEKVGLVGYTGAGKSSFINLILRFFPLESGKILIDGQEIANVTLESLRRQIALIPQEPLLFHRTLRENISYGKPEATESEIIQAAKLAHCDEFIRNIPGGYEAKVGERGTKLSGGEKQRVAIARASLVNAPILILDEATSSLDSVTEKYIQDSLATLMQNRTTIVIAHRLSTLSRMDRILVFDQGKIVEEGTHASLLNKNGLYARMWNMQVGGFLPGAPV
jgi:ATP-binding cassette, subfamily B, bacterial